MKCILQYTKRAQKDLLKMDKKQSKMLVAKLHEYIKSNSPMAQAKPLKGELTGLYRFRIGKYRAIFTTDKHGKIIIITIIHIAKRGEVYS